MHSDEWNDIASKMSEFLRSCISRYDHISEITLTWARPEPENAPHAEGDILILEERLEHAASRNSGYSVRVVGIGTTESRQRYEQMGFEVPSSSGGSSDVEQGPEHEGRMRNSTT